MGNKFLLSTLATFLILFALDFVWYGYLMSNFYPTDGMRASPIWLYLSVGYLIFSLLFSYMYPKGVEGSNKTVQGLRFGILIGLLIGLPFAFIEHSLSLTPVLDIGMVDAFYMAVKFGIAGVVVANIYGIPGNEPEE